MSELSTRRRRAESESNGGEGGIRTHVPVTRQDAFEAPPLRPLRYLSYSNQLYGAPCRARFSTPVASAITSISTARLLLRVPELADAEPLMAVFWDPEVVAQKQVTLREQPGGI